MNTGIKSKKVKLLSLIRENWGGEIMILAIISLLIYAATKTASYLEAQEATQTLAARQIIDTRPTLAESDYCLPISANQWFIEFQNDGQPCYFVCTQIRIIGPLEDRTTIIGQSGNIKSPTFGQIKDENLREAERCWNADQSAFTTTSYYEFRDGVCLIIKDYALSNFTRFEEAKAWQEEYAKDVPQYYQK